MLKNGLKVAVFLAILLSFVSTALRAEKMERIVAIVNGDIITDEELNMFVRAEVEMLGQALGEEKVKELKHEFLERMIEDRLIIQEAKRQQIKADPKVVEERVRDIKERAGSEQAFEAALKSQGISLNKLRDKLTDQLLIYNLVQKEVRSKVVVSPKEVTDYFNQHENEFVTPEAVVVDSIFVKDQDDAAKVQRELSSGKSFEEVAKAFSKKTNLGEVLRGQFKKDLEDFIFALKVGESSASYAAEDGFYFFFAKEKLEPSKKKLEEIKDHVSELLERGKMQQAFKEWIEGMKEKAYISIRE